MLSWRPDHVTALGTLMVESSLFPSELVNFEEPDMKMASLIGLARSQSLNFCIVKRFGLFVVVRF